jgi:hypothetical protein
MQLQDFCPIVVTELLPARWDFYDASPVGWTCSMMAA